MNPKYLRVFKKVDLDDIQEHVLVCGDLSANCAKCGEVGVKIDSVKCPSCQADFKYVTFRSLKDNFPKVQKISETRPSVIIVDYDDYKRLTGTAKAKDFFKL